MQRKFTQRSDRVKSVDMHPTEPWVLCALYSGKVAIYNYASSTTVRSFDVSELPVRCAKFIARRQWIVAGADDMLVRVFNYNTQERIAAFEGHQDYIRYMEVHPSQPYLLTCSDDMQVRRRYHVWTGVEDHHLPVTTAAPSCSSNVSIIRLTRYLPRPPRFQVRLWDWDKNWTCVNTFEGHAHYVMMARINPKDTNTFATASLDRSVKVWSLGAPTPNFSLEGHERGVNCVDYYPGGDKPYIVSGADDHTLKLWDYQTRSCVATLEGHTNNVCAVAFHARLPVILSGSEDGTVRVWHNTTYRLESTLNYGFERAWAVSASPNSHKVAIGFDDGTIVVKLGREMPVASMDRSGRIIVARNNVIYSATAPRSGGGASASAVGEDGDAAVAPGPPVPPPEDGQAISLSEKELGSVELFPQAVSHNANGRFVAVVGDGEYVIYTAQALRNKCFGAALDFVWSASGTGDYAVRESPTRVKVFKNFKEVAAFKPGVAAEGLFGGALLCVRAADALLFYDWDDQRLVRRVEVGGAKGAYWSDSGELLAVAAGDSLYILRFSRDAWVAGAAEATAAGGATAAALADEGVEAALELQHDVSERVRGGVWVGDVFLYVSGASRLAYCVGGEVVTLAHLDRPLYMLGYLPREGRVFLVDKAGSLVSYALLAALLEYQTAVVRRDFGAANRVLRDVPREQHNAIAKFLEGQGFKEEALAVADDPDLKFDLAVQLNKLDVALALLRAQAAIGDAAAGSDTAAKWKALMDLALARSDIALAEECASAARDLPSLLLIHSSTGDAAGLRRVGAAAREDGRGNVAFAAAFALGAVEECVALLVDSGRFAEAAFFARTYAPSSLAAIMPRWKADAAKYSRRAAESLAEPPSGGAASDKFPDWAVALQAEVRASRLCGSVVCDASFTRLDEFELHAS